MTKTVFLVKQTQPEENYHDFTFKVFDTLKEAEKCCEWHNKEYGNDVDPCDESCHFYDIEEINVETKFKVY